MSAPATPGDAIDTLRRRARALDRLLDGAGRVTRWPRRNSDRQLVLDYLVEFVPRGDVLSERQVNELLASLHTFRDTALLRRALIDRGLLDRRPDGSAYWRPEHSG